MAKTKQERLEELIEKQKQLKEQERKIRSQISADERKKRTKHLIEIGGAVYSVLGDSYQDGDVERLIDFLQGQEQRGKYFSKAMRVNKSDNEEQ
ncbi:MAG: hypothetical protein NC205_02580 [Prevotella sp.]|nr:hypothetical protein [Alistipes senegalensis]MCM1357454.1 hypothetical protein [Prevotella sp.]MCM1473199.1 hypothetical protein [Muribaculaceae bacterium]